MNKKIRNINIYIYWILLALFISNIGYGQDHFVILIDGGGKTRSHENNPMLKKLLLDSIPEVLFNKGIVLKDSTIIRADKNDFFSVSFYGALSHKKVKHYGHKDYLQVNTLFPALKKISIEKNYIHQSAINFSSFDSKTTFVNKLKKEIKNQDLYWYGFASIADYAYMKILNDNKSTIQNTIILIVVKDLEYNGEGIASERRFIKEHIKDYNKIADVFKTISDDYDKNEIGNIKVKNINSYIFSFYPKIHDSIRSNYPNNIIDKINFNKEISEDSLFNYSIKFNEDYFNFINKYENRIDSIVFNINIDNRTIPVKGNENKINFFYQIDDTVEICNLGKEKIKLTISLLIKDEYFGKKWIKINKQKPINLPEYYRCEIRFWIFFALKLIILLFIVLVLVLYIYLRVFKSEIYYDIEHIGSHNNLKRSNNDIVFDKVTKIRFYYEPKNKIKFIWNILSKIAHSGVKIEHNNTIHRINDMPLVISFSDKESLKISQKGIKSFNINYKIKK
jgi:hypothetical protein